MYSEHELKELRRAIYENAAEQLLWQVMYINAVAQHSPALNIVRNKLLALPRTFELIMHNSINSPAVKDLTQAVYSGNRLFVEYVDSVFNGNSDKTALGQNLNDNIEYIANLLHKINPQWGTAEWMTLINHQVELLNTVMNDAKQGKYDTWTYILPVLHKIKLDMADYLEQGISTYQ